MNIRRKATREDTNVHYALLDKDGKRIKAFGMNSEYGAACFSELSYGSIPDEVTTILVVKSVKQVPYHDEACKLWVEEISSLGFPVKYLGASEQDPRGSCQAFELAMDNFKHKFHLTATLCLLRCLFEQYISDVPEIYINWLMDNQSASESERFDAIQNAHKDKRISEMANINHMVTYKTNGANVTKEELFKRYEELNMAVRSKYERWGYGEKPRWDNSGCWKGQIL